MVVDLRALEGVPSIDQVRHPPLESSAERIDGEVERIDGEAERIDGGSL